MNSWLVFTKILMKFKGEYWEEDLCLTIDEAITEVKRQASRRWVMLAEKN